MNDAFHHFNVERISFIHFLETFTHSNSISSSFHCSKYSSSSFHNFQENKVIAQISLPRISQDHPNVFNKTANWLWMAQVWHKLIKDEILKIQLKKLHLININLFANIVDRTPRIKEKDSSENNTEWIGKNSKANIEHTFRVLPGGHEGFFLTKNKYKIKMFESSSLAFTI